MQSISTARRVVIYNDYFGSELCQCFDLACSDYTMPFEETSNDFRVSAWNLVSG